MLTALVIVPTFAGAQDLEEGRKAFGACAACHDVGETAKNKIGPPLNGMVGRKAATVGGFSFYSDALKASGIVWDENTLGKFIANPRSLVPTTKMGFAGIRDEKRIAEIIGYLSRFDAAGKVVTPAPMPGTTSQDAQPDPANLGCLQSLDTPAAKEKCAAVGGELLQAIGAIVSSDTAASGYGKFDGLSLVDQDEQATTRYVTRLKMSAADPCRVEETDFSQPEIDRWATLIESVYDFHKITRVRYLVSDADYASDASAKETDPAVRTIALEGEWICRDTYALDPAQIGTGQTCEKVFLASTEKPENRAVLIPALNVIAKACGVPK